jgi:hypothetical protein
MVVAINPSQGKIGWSCQLFSNQILQFVTYAPAIIAAATASPIQ